MDKGMNFFYILSAPLGYVMEWIYKLLPRASASLLQFAIVCSLTHSKIP